MRHITLFTIISLALLAAVAQMSAADKALPRIFRIPTDKTDLILRVGDNGRLYQAYFGERLRHDSDIEAVTMGQSQGSDAQNFSRGWDVMSGQGNEDFFEPAISIVHSDGNPSTILVVDDYQSEPIDGGTEHIITLKDPAYPVRVRLHYAVYPRENIYKSWTEISHTEKAPVTLRQYNSSMLYFSNLKYFLTQFSSDWAREMQETTQQLLPGKKVIDTKLGSRQNMIMDPFFEVGLDRPASEDEGMVLMGTLGWTGNFRFTFEVDNAGNLRVISGINPYASDYELRPGEPFTTPQAIFTLSGEGRSSASRSFHDWARRYSLKDGMADRMTLLNNWENTYFDFDHDRLASLMKEAKALGVDMFLLDDGWFANGPHARNHDRAGLGDWEHNRDKLPGGIKALTEAADEAGVKFGLWIEPEMVNPNSELYERHPEWVIQYPNRDTYYYRHQLVLDLSNPAVQDYVFSIVDHILEDNPDVAYFKWDCNSPITNIYSPYLGRKQSGLYIDHVRGLYNVLSRVREKYPSVPMMLCSGGGSRCDYEALKYFTEFWCSDNTDPYERLFIQWGFSHFFPAKAMCAHVTSWNRKTSIKFRTDVASMCKLGFDIGLQDLNADELEYCRTAVSNWNRLKPVILEGDQYRLVSPYETNHMALNYVDSERNHALLFAYDLHPRYAEKTVEVCLKGLDPDKIYLVREINLFPNEKSLYGFNDRAFTGDYLMKVGLPVFTSQEGRSHVVEFTAAE